MKISNLYKLFLTIEKIGYAGGGDKFEKAVKDVLLKFEFTELFPIINNDSNGRSKKVDKFLSSYTGDLNMCFISQPRGTHGCPDYWVYIDNKKFKLECKSSKSGGIRWNSGRPRNDIVYAYNCGATKKTYLFMGQDHIGDMTDFETIVMPMLKQIKEKQKAINDLIINLGYGDKFYQNFRADWLDKGKISESYTKQKRLNVYKFIKKEVLCY